MTRNAHQLVAFFPYVFVEGGIEVDGVHVKPSLKHTIDQEGEELSKTLLTLIRFFRLGENQQQVTYWSYALATASTSAEYDSFRKKLHRFSNVIRFIELSKDRTNRFSNFNFFIIDLHQGAALPQGDFAYFEVALNGLETIGFDIHNGACTRTYESFEPISPALINASELQNHLYFKLFYIEGTPLFGDTNELQRIFHAVEWFNRSYSHASRGVDLSEAIIDLHIAFEALLRPSDDEKGVKAQIRTAMFALLGHAEELDHWFTSFHLLRNSIVHGDAASASFNYVHRQSKLKIGNKPHLYLARKIFIKCINALLDARAKMPLMGFKEELIPNDYRVDTAIRELKRRTATIQELYKRRAFSLISELRLDDRTSSKSETVELGRLLIPHIARDLEAFPGGPAPNNILGILEEIKNWTGTNIGELALIYSRAQMAYQSTYFTHREDPIEMLMLRSAAYHFFDYATWRLFVFID